MLQLIGAEWVLGLAGLCAMSLAIGLAWADEEEERVIGVEGVVRSVELTTETHTTDSGRTYEVATLLVAIDTPAPLVVYEDMSTRTAHAEALQRDFVASGRDHLVFSMEALVDGRDDAELRAYAKLVAGRRIVLRGPYAAVAEHIAGRRAAAVIYKIEPDVESDTP